MMPATRIELNIEEAISELLQDDKIISRIVPESIDPHVRDMKAVAAVNISKFSHSRERKKEDIERYIDADYTTGLAFALGMPMTVFRLISDGIREFTQ
jgi:hypothetical protein